MPDVIFSVEHPALTHRCQDLVGTKSCAVRQSHHFSSQLSLEFNLQVAFGVQASFGVQALACVYREQQPKG